MLSDLNLKIFSNYYLKHHNSAYYIINNLHNRPPLYSTLFPYTTLFRSVSVRVRGGELGAGREQRVSQVGRPLGTYLQQRSEEHTSELQSRFDLVCRLLLEKKNQFMIEILLSPFQ